MSARLLLHLFHYLLTPSCTCFLSCIPNILNPVQACLNIPSCLFLSFSSYAFLNRIYHPPTHPIHFPTFYLLLSSFLLVRSSLPHLSSFFIHRHAPCIPQHSNLPFLPVSLYALLLNHLSSIYSLISISQTIFISFPSTCLNPHTSSSLIFSLTQIQPPTLESTSVPSFTHPWIPHTHTAFTSS